MSSARRIQPDFQLTTENINAVSHLCRMVEGMPLAVVLAAGWARILTPAEIVTEMKKNLDFLTTDENELPESLRSIRAVFDYSWTLLSEAEQDVFMKLSVFRGGFTREAVEAVTGASLRNLLNLSNKSFIRRDVYSGRYEIHDLLRQYAEEKLLSSHQKDIIRDHHARYYLSRLDTWAEHLYDHHQVQVAQNIDQDFENIRSAWFWANEHEQDNLLVSAGISLLCYAWIRNKDQEILTWYRTATDRMKTKSNLNYARLSIIQTDFESSQLTKTPLVWREKLKNLLLIVDNADEAENLEYERLVGRLILSNVLELIHDHNLQSEALELLAELSTALETANGFYIVSFHNWLGINYCKWGRYKEGYAHLQRSYELAKEKGDLHDIAVVLSALGGHFTDDLKASELNLREALAICRQLNLQTRLILVLNFLGYNLLNQFRLDEALACFQELYTMTQMLGEIRGILWALIGLSYVEGARGNYSEAMRLANDYASHDPDPLPEVLIMNYGWNGELEKMRPWVQKWLKNLESRPSVNSTYLLNIMGAMLPLARLDWGTLRAVEVMSLLANHPRAGKLSQEHAFTRQCHNVFLAEVGADAFDVAWERGKRLTIEGALSAFKTQYAFFKEQ